MLQIVTTYSLTHTHTTYTHGLHNITDSQTMVAWVDRDVELYLALSPLAVCCSVLQCVAVCCSVLQCATLYDSCICALATHSPLTN